MDNPDDDDGSGGDSDLEAELAAITAGERKTKPKPQKPKAIPQSDLDKLVAESLRDIGLRFECFAIVDIILNSISFFYRSKVPMKSCREMMMIRIY